MTTFGEISWTDDVFPGGEKKNTKDLFLKLDEGSNEMRLVTQPFQYLVHKVKKEGEKGYGQKVNCSAIHGSCPVCEMGDKAKPRWLIGVISRKTGTYKIVDISYAVYSQIRKYARNLQRWGDPTKYDIDIVVDKDGGPTGYYAVQPIPKEPLSAADQVIKDSADLEDLKRRVTPPTPEQAQKRLDKVLNGGVPAVMAPETPSTPATTAKGKSTQKSKAPPKVEVVEEESDDDFPTYEE